MMISHGSHIAGESETDCAERWRAHYGVARGWCLAQVLRQLHPSPVMRVYYRTVACVLGEFTAKPLQEPHAQRTQRDPEPSGARPANARRSEATRRRTSLSKLAEDWRKTWPEVMTWRENVDTLTCDAPSSLERGREAHERLARYFKAAPTKPVFQHLDFESFIPMPQKEKAPVKGPVGIEAFKASRATAKKSKSKLRQGRKPRSQSRGKR